LFSHALDRLAQQPALHGEQVGVGTIMMMYLQGGDWEEIRDALTVIGAPTTAKALGISPKEITEALVHAHEVRPDRYTILGDKGLSPEAADHVATLTGVI
ncbi:MAG: NAD(P)-dependent glycerol-1-phosphate dehydrogenase, partial [Candidatus Methylomirabilales bacterium]